ncbi:MAG: hypothetical protein NUW02_03060 [Candidatus Campbellbacteria bacterium]|nr:hypothetical protein [Candidatus Campbellbacteria bacterium]
MEKQIGTVSHWFDKINVAVIKLTEPLAVGDTIKIKHGNEEFEETVSSLQVDHEDVEKTKKGDEAAVKLSQKAKEHSLVYKVE